MSDKTHVIVRSDGDADYTTVYGPFSAEEIGELEFRLPEDDGDYFWRVMPLSSRDELETALFESGN
jgi:hypothetical protein